MNAAPLKHVRSRNRSLDCIAFPRSYERGPIEATRFLCGLHPHPRPFRVPMNAAPLKPRHDSHRRHGNGTFRVPMNAAPLKRLPCKRCGCGTHRFPRSYERGPIEAGDRGLPWTRYRPPTTVLCMLRNARRYSSMFMRATQNAIPGSTPRWGNRIHVNCHRLA